MSDYGARVCDANNERMRNIRLREGWVECGECKDIVPPGSDDALSISDKGLCVGCVSGTVIFDEFSEEEEE